jgi:hypothetical protein
MTLRQPSGATSQVIHGGVLGEVMTASLWASVPEVRMLPANGQGSCPAHPSDGTACSLSGMFAVCLLKIGKGRN